MAVPSLRRLAARIPIHPFELVTYGGVAAIVLVLRAHGLRIDLHSVEFMAGPMARRLPFFLLWGLGLQALTLVVARRSPREWVRGIATPRSALLWLRVCVASMATTYGYAWLKVCVPLLQRDIRDGGLATLDRALHLGWSPNAVALDLFGGALTARALDTWYGFWLTSVAAAMAWIFLSPRLAERRHFAFACAVLWLGGATLYAAIPALGPCFTNPTMFDGVRAFLPTAAALQEALARNYATMLAGRDGSLNAFNPYFGVAALPSLHVGAHWLLTLWARRRARRLVPVFASMTLLTFVASLVTGWHFAIDAYVGMLLAWGAIRLADRFEPAGPPAEGAAEPGAARRLLGRVRAALARGRDGSVEASARFVLWPYEVASHSVAYLTLFFLIARGLPYDGSSVAYSFEAFLGLLPQMAILGIPARLLVEWISGRSVREYLRRIRSWRWAIGYVRLWAATTSVGYAYAWFKVSLPLLRADVLDAQVWAIERFLHFGFSPTVFAIELVAGTPLARVIDYLYYLWLPSLPLILGYVFVSADARRRANFALANVFLWTFGAWLYLAIPALGPCYFSPDVLDPIRDQLPMAVHAQDALWSNYLTMVRGRHGEIVRFLPTGGVAALPSLHVGFYALMLFWSRRHDRRLVLPFAVATAVIFFGSLVTAWHYAVDGYVALGLAWLSTRLADRWQPVGSERGGDGSAASEPVASGPPGGSAPEA